MKDLELQISELAGRLGVSSALLRCVYFRGISECSANSYPGSPVLYGLARVQKFANASAACDQSLTLDIDLLPQEASTCSDAVVLTADEYLEFTDTIRSSFSPGQPDGFVIEDDRKLTVFGDLNSQRWRYSLDILTGATDFEFV